jgi:hypothetical protein
MGFRLLGIAGLLVLFGIYLIVPQFQQRAVLIVDL